MKLKLFSLSAALAFAGYLPQTPAAEPETVWLSSLDLSPIVQGWGQPQADKAVTGKPLSIGGKTFERGLGTHTDSLVRLQLKGGSEKFSAFVGVDDAAGQRSGQHLLPGHRRRQDAIPEPRDETRPGRPEGRGGRQRNQDAAADRGPHGATFPSVTRIGPTPSCSSRGAPGHCRLAARRAPSFSRPSRPRTPRINGARIFGVHPGHPFLFTIPATGDRPMTFAVDHLPKGLTRGRRRPAKSRAGSRSPATYVVTLRAANALGKAKRKFKIVCGETLALTPHMGWNSWYVWESHVTDQIMRDAADAMVSSGMINHGYQYVNIDDCWAVEAGLDRPDARRRAARRQRHGQRQPALPRHEGPHRLHPLEGPQGGHLHFAGADAPAPATSAPTSTRSWTPGASPSGAMTSSNTIGVRMAALPRSPTLRPCRSRIA